MIDDILLFVDVVKAGSLLAVAKKKNIPQSTLSRHMKSLEQNLEINLFERHARGIELTNEGRAIFEQFKDYAQELSNRLAEVTNPKLQLTGRLNVLISFPLAHYIIMPYVHQFSARYPGLELAINYSFRELDSMAQSYDIAVINYLPKEQMQKIKVVSADKIIAVCNKDYIKEYGLLTEVAELNQHVIVGPQVMHTDKALPLKLYHEQTDKVINVNLNFRLCFNNFVQAKQVVDSGAAIAGLPIHLVRKELDEGRLVRVLTDYHAGTICYYMLRNLDINDQRYQVFNSFLEECLARVLPRYEETLNLKQVFIA